MKKTRTRPGSTTEELKSTLTSKGAGSLYLLYGTEPLLIERAAAMITHTALKDSDPGMNHQTFSGEETDGRTISAAAAAYPMLGGRRLVVVKDAEKLRETEPLLSYLADPNPTTTLLFISAKPDFRQKLFQALEKKAFLLECLTPYDDRIGAWIDGEVRQSDRTISPDACELLRLSVGGSLGEIQSELEKLFTYVGTKKEINRDDVAAVVGVSRQFTIFDLQRALGESDTPRALGIVYKMLDRGENMTGYIVLLTRFFGKLWLLAGRRISVAEAPAFLGVPPSYVREYLTASATYPAGRLEQCFIALRDADRKLKTSGGTPRQIMTLLIHHITQRNPG